MKDVNGTRSAGTGVASEIQGWPLATRLRFRKDAGVQEKYAYLRGRPVVVLGPLEWHGPGDGIERWEKRQWVYLADGSQPREGAANPNQLEVIPEGEYEWDLSDGALDLDSDLISVIGRAGTLFPNVPFTPALNRHLAKSKAFVERLAIDAPNLVPAVVLLSAVDGAVLADFSAFEAACKAHGWTRKHRHWLSEHDPKWLGALCAGDRAMSESVQHIREAITKCVDAGLKAPPPDFLWSTWRRYGFVSGLSRGGADWVERAFPATHARLILKGVSDPAIACRDTFVSELESLCQWAAMRGDVLDTNQFSEGWDWALGQAEIWKGVELARARASDAQLACPDLGCLSGGLRSAPVDSEAALVELGIELSNCLVSEFRHYTRPNLANYALHRDDRMIGVYTLRRRSKGFWECEEAALAGGRPAGGEESEFIRKHLAVLNARVQRQLLAERKQAATWQSADDIAPDFDDERDWQFVLELAWAGNEGKPKSARAFVVADVRARNFELAWVSVNDGRRYEWCVQGDQTPETALKAALKYFDDFVGAQAVDLHVVRCAAVLGAQRDFVERWIASKRRPVVDITFPQVPGGQDGFPNRPPASATYLGQAVWSWSPMHDRSDTYYVSRRRKSDEWLLWSELPVDCRVGGDRWSICAAAKGSFSGHEEAGRAMLAAFWKAEFDDAMIDAPHELYSGAVSLEALSDEVF